MIDPIYLKRLLAELLATPSVTGHTEAIVVRLTEILQELGLKCTFPRKGGVQVFLPGRGPMVLVTGDRSPKYNGRNGRGNPFRWNALLREGRRLYVSFHRG